MSLKGNVAGLGLGELLQSLARGGRDGALTLYGDGLHAVIGFQDAQLYLLPGEDETEDQWRVRAKDAWANEPSPHLEARRRQAISYAGRLEILYRMLDSSNLHFSFWPGRLAQYKESRAAAKRPKDEDEGRDATSISGGELPGSGRVSDEDWGPGMAVEGLLLEHARLADEATTEAAAIGPYDLPRSFDDGHRVDLRSLLGQCDGKSTMQEITDRLGWPVRKGYAELRNLLASGRARLASPRELLAAGLSELEMGFTSRAASRFVGWLRSLDCGPLEAGDAEALIDEWERGRLAPVLQVMPGREARALVRRLDLVHQDRAAMIDRWTKLHGFRRTDTCVTLHWLALRSAEASVEGRPPFPELIRLARHYNDAGHPARARVALRIAAGLAPTRLGQRIELGTRMLENGMLEDGAHWLLTVAQELIDQRQGERALAPLRTVLEADPTNREARAMQAQARQRSSHNRKRRRNSVIGLAVVLAFSAAALVQVRTEQQQRKKLEIVTDHLDDPETAIEKLDEFFPGDDSPRVLNLRQQLKHRIREEQRKAQEDWIGRFREVQQECEVGDPMLGLQRTLDMAQPPEGTTPLENLPHRTEIFNTLMMRFRQTATNVEPSAESSMQERHAEERFALMLEEILQMLDARPLERDPEAFAFRAQVGNLVTSVRERQERRASERAAQEQAELEQQLDLLLAAARAHRDAGDVERAQTTYSRFQELDTDGELTEFLQPEIRAVQEHYEAYMAARDRAWAGDHAGALRLLTRTGTNGLPVCPNPGEHMLPWRVTSEPEGARAVFSDGLERVAPFTYESAFGDPIEIGFSLEGSEDRTVRIDGPQDLLVRMHQLPERTWTSTAKIEALPLPVQNDHVVCDREGRLARITPSGETVWQLQLPTLGGVARTPVFLPAKRGFLLVVSEDGKAWVVDALSGEERSSWSAGSPLVEGPLVRSGGAVARFRDGRIAEWTDDSPPTVHEAIQIYSLQENPLDKRGALPPGHESAGNLIALHRRATAASSLASEWLDWVVEVYEEEYLVRRGGSSRGGFSVSRHGEWSFVAWEMPNPRMTQGRLWVSDEAGLRSYLPKP